MKKGQIKRVWTPEQKAEIVHKHLDEHISVRTLEKQYIADRSMICHWVKKYIAEGECSFIHKGHPGNEFAALHVSKNLSELERLRLMVVLHTDQGSVYSSQAFRQAHEHYNIKRSMS